MKKICFVTATRAEYFLLSRLMKKIEKHPMFQLQIVATGMHLSPEFGLTYQDIEKDGFSIDEKVEMLLSSDTPEGISKSMGLAMLSFPSVFQRLQPDLLVILGDRYEMLAITSVACIFQIPIAHLHGGEITEGAFDEAIRHALTKMSYLHFTSTEEYKNRVIQLGEHPNRVFSVGGMGIENIMETNLLSRQELEHSIDFSLGNSFALVTFHPVTLEQATAQEQMEELLSALGAYPDMKVIFTKANSDTDGRIINQMIDEVVREYPEKYVAFASLGLLRYLSAMKYCDFVIGNSSSGLLEAPSFQKPTINVGDRQKGRLKAKSVIDCNPNREEILFAMHKGKESSFLKEIIHVKNPYGDGKTSDKIIQQLEIFFKESVIELKKSFYDMEVKL